jgi:50S ribosomal subunit-associated GTPase HflX
MRSIRIVLMHVMHCAPRLSHGQISPWRFVDLPGHASQRTKLDSLKSVSKAIIFVVDGSAPASFGKVAQQLYTLLVDPVVTARRTPVFLAINKTDLLAEVDTSKPKVNAPMKKQTKNDSDSESESESESEDESSHTAVGAIAKRLEEILSVAHACAHPALCAHLCMKCKCDCAVHGGGRVH